MYYIVEEKLTVIRYHVVVGTKKSAIQNVKDCEKNTQYLHSCDEIQWQGKTSYKVEEFPEDWEADKRLVNTVRQIKEEIEIPAEKPIDKSAKPRKIPKRKEPPKCKTKPAMLTDLLKIKN